MECGAFTVHRQLDIVPSTDRPSDAEAGQFFCWRLPSEAMQELTEGRSTGIPKIRAATPTSSPPRTTPSARRR